MTVAEYIQALQQLPQDAEVAVSDYRHPLAAVRQTLQVEKRHRSAYARFRTSYPPCVSLDATSLYGPHTIACPHCAAGVPLVQVVVL